MIAFRSDMFNKKELSVTPITYIVLYFSFICLCVLSGFNVFGIFAFTIFPVLCKLNVDVELPAQVSKAEGKSQIVSVQQSAVAKKSVKTKVQYSIDQLRRFKTENSSKDYRIVSVISNEEEERRSVSPKLHDAHWNGNDQNHCVLADGKKRWRASFSSSRSVSPTLSVSSSDSASSRSSSRSHNSHDNNLHDVYRRDPKTLPKELISGKIQWIHNNNGRIRSNTRISGIRDIFFHFNDIESKESVRLGQNVHFNVSVYENRLCATHIIVD